MNNNISILGTGSYLPPNEVYSETLDARFGFKKGFVRKLTGLTKRNYVSDERACEMGAKAANKALAKASMSIDDIDCIIAACGTMDQAIPCNAVLIHKQLTPKNPIPAFDINMTCLSNMMALDLASGLLAGKQYKNILIVSSDIASVGLDWADVHTAGIFGDGAAALIISKDSPPHRSSLQKESLQGASGILGSKFETYSEASDFCQIRGAGTGMPPSKVTEDYADLCNFQMKGKKLYRKAAQILPKFVEELLKEANVSLDDIDWVVPHQASALALEHIQKKLNIPERKMINIYSDHGNQIAASIPTALDHLIRNRAIKKGDLILMLGTSAGLSIGGMVLKY